jgi:UDP-4-amino-4,6-dideoxy-N-acetyl-beta-L-altrosamine N-acetyltransferase
MTAQPSTPRNIQLILLINLDTESQMLIRELRNEEYVRKWMYTDHIIGTNEHLEWINSLKTDNKKIVFAIIDENSTPLGIVSVNSIDRHHGNADWGYYLTQNARGGLGSAVEYAFINFVFDSLKLEKLNGEIIEGNDAVIKLHNKFSFKDEGFRRLHIMKNGQRKGIHLIGLTKADWYTDRASIYEKHRNILDKFEISLQWKYFEYMKKTTPIDNIEAARARNNLNWMSILRLALEKSPETAKAIVNEIKKTDQEILGLTNKLINE